MTRMKLLGVTCCTVGTSRRFLKPALAQPTRSAEPWKASFLTLHQGLQRQPGLRAQDWRTRRWPGAGWSRVEWAELPRDAGLRAHLLK